MWKCIRFIERNVLLCLRCGNVLLCLRCGNVLLCLRCGNVLDLTS